MNYDLVIRNGIVVDGSGRAGARADVGIRGDRIETVGRIDEKGAHEIDAEGHVVTPGFVDGHTHLDAQICWDPLGTSAAWHGVTSVVMGNCGFSVAPCRESEKHLALRSLERAEDISAEVLAEGVEWRWETFRDYLNVVEAAPKGIHHAAYVGHCALRTYVMGERAFEQAATPDDVDAMRSELEDALRAGAVGFTTSRSASHQTSDDRPVASRLADWDEVRRLVGVMGELGTGVFEIANEQHADPGELAAYHTRLLDLAVESGRPVSFIVASSHQIPGGSGVLLDLLDRTAEAGGRMFGQAHSREFQALLSFRAGLPFDRLEGWKAFRDQPLEAQRVGLRDPALRRRLLEEARRGDYGHAIGAEARPPDYDWIRIFDTPLPPHRTVAEMASERGVDPAELMIDLCLESDLDQLFVQPFANQDLDAVLEILKHPRTVVGTSDTGAHVSQISDSSIPTHLLSYWVRDREAFSFEQAIRMLSFEPARAWGFLDRGLVREGFVADLNVIDAARVAPRMPELVHDLPGGSPRFVQKSEGIAATVVAGECLLRDGVHTGALPGRLLRPGMA
jgi:N-acyl-D-aspartate/D-glutamate deacylase